MTDALRLYWRFNDVQSGQVFDSSGTGNTGQLDRATGNVSASPLKPNEPISEEDEWGEKAALGHFLTGQVSIASLQGIDSLTALTVECYIRRTRSVTSEEPCAFLSLTRAIQVRITSANVLTVQIGPTVYETTKRIPLHQWCHIALVLDHSSLSVLCDAVPVFSNIQTSISPPISLEIGTSFLQCTEVRVWSSARSLPELREWMRSPLPVKGTTSFSRWRGLRIKSANDDDPVIAPIASFAAPLTVSDAVLVGKSRRVNEEDSMSLQSLSILNDSVVPEPSGRLLQDHPGSPHSPPLNKPSGDVAVNLSYLSLEPGIEVDAFADDLRSIKPRALPRQIDQALAVIDEMLQNAIPLDKRVFSQLDLVEVIRTVAAYVFENFRVGSFICPFPPESIISRLRIACNYLALSRIDGGGILPALSIPLLGEHVVMIAKELIANRAVVQGMRVELAKHLLGTFKEQLSDEDILFLTEITKSCGERGTWDVLPCPFCKSHLHGIVEPVCRNGCHTRLVVCYLSGRWMPAEDCVKCTLCASVVSVRRKSRAGMTRGLPTTRNTDVPKICPICNCTGSLNPISIR